MRMNNPLFVLSFLTAFSAAALAIAGPTFSSGGTRVSLVELYTSEGCSSCPPAEKWLSGLSSQPGLWTKFVPVAFHVTYWDNLGWKDGTGQGGFNERQRAYAAGWGMSTVYTPCFVRNGAEWHPNEENPAIASTATGVLELAETENGSVKATFVPAKDDERRYDVTVALLGNGMVTKVLRGENAGRDLVHDFVVLSLQTTPLQADATGKLTSSVVLPKVKAPRLALAAWIVERGTISPLQATGGWLP